MKKNPGMAFPARGKLKKILWVMKLKIFLILFSCLQLHAAVHSQNAVKISLDLENVSLEEVIWAIEKQTNFVFMYGTNDVEQVKPLTINEKDKEIGEILNICLQNTGLCYEISGNAVIIKKGMPQVEGRKITGKVTDEKGNTLPGVTVLIKGTSIGVSTDAEGKYTLSLPAGKHVLLFSMVGMQTKEVPVGSSDQINIVMQEEVSEMEEVVVTGYFTRKRESYTGVATSFKGEELREISGQNVLTALSIIDPSFQLMENLEMGSDPNTIPAFQIRGPGSLESEYKNNPNRPTFVLDGFEVSVEKIFDLDPNRVANVTVLKAAAATAIYGSRAANGVVVIETVQPKEGELNVSYTLGMDFEVADLSVYNIMISAEK